MSQKRSNLSSLLTDFDLPLYIAEHYPDSRATPGRGGSILASWRGEMHASASLYQHDNIWFVKDHGTDEAYNGFSFLTQVEGLSKREALQVIAPEVIAQVDDVRAVYDSYDVDSAPAALKGRGFTKADLKKLGIKADGDDALLPIYDDKGEVVNLKRRLAHGNMKYKYEVSGLGNTPWHSPGFRDNDRLVIVEGELNAMIAYVSANNVAYLGMPGASTSLPPRVATDKVVYVYGDNDPAGKGAVARWVGQAHAQGADAVFAVQPMPADFCDTAGEVGKEEFVKLLASSLSGADQKYSLIEKVVAAGYTVGELRERSKKYISAEVAIPTGYTELDGYTLGLPESGIVLVCALPSFGKSIMVRDILLHNVLELNKKVMLFSPDQSPASIFRFLASKISGIPLNQVRTADPHPYYLEKFGGRKEIRQRWGEVYDDCLLNLSKKFRIGEEDEVGEIREAMERGVDDGFELFAVDYVQLLEPDEGENAGAAVKGLKKLSRQLKVPIVLATQLAKYKFPHGGGRNGIPFASDIEGSGKYYQAAEQVYMIYNRDMYWREYVDESHAPKEPPGWDNDGGRVRVYVRKNKDGAWGGYIHLNFNTDLVTFEDANLGVL